MRWFLLILILLVGCANSKTTFLGDGPLRLEPGSYLPDDHKDILLIEDTEKRLEMYNLHAVHLGYPVFVLSPLTMEFLLKQAEKARRNSDF